MFKRVLGTKDILPQEIVEWQKIEQLSRDTFKAYNYQEVRTPIIEDASLFNRSLGSSAEIVQRQMFLLKRERDLYALRPEGTAAIVRAYIENNLDKTSGMAKLYYIGPMFRAERPQKGRLRQFHHIGCEAIGSVNSDIDSEVISLANRLMQVFSVTDYHIKINSLGCQKDKEDFVDFLQRSLKSKVNKLCEECRVRLKHNPLRILDCKDDNCREIVKQLEIGDSCQCQECKEHFSKVKNNLDTLDVSYEVSPTLVRGLDYYTRTVFEITHKDLGSQDALGAGGRYDNLVKELGGPDMGAAGFAFGVERILLVQSQKPEVKSQELVYVIPLGEEARKNSLRLLNDLRQENIPSDTDYECKSLKGAMRKANDLGAKHVLIIGDDELGKGVVTLKDMVSGEQKEVSQEDIIKEIKC